MAQPRPIRQPVETVDDLLKHGSLLVPVDAADNGPQVSLVETLSFGKEKDLLLNIRSEIQELHDLRDTGPRNPAESGQLGIIPKLFRSQHPIKPNGERQEPGDAGNGAISPFVIRPVAI